MPVVPSFVSVVRRLRAPLVATWLIALAVDQVAAFPVPADAAGQAAAATPGHLLVSEVMTGGAGASDEFIELYNPTPDAMALDGLEVVYVSSTGATVTRKAAWPPGSAGLPPGSHLLIANSAGIFAGLADVTYANGLSATGGSVALRLQGAGAAVDAVGWGTAASTWLETRPAPAPAAGSSLERLPAGPAGSSQDTDDNLLDFVIQPTPEPQNLGSAPIVTPTPTPLPTLLPTESDSPTAEPTAEPTATATPSETPSATASPTDTRSPAPTDSPTPTPTPTPSPITVAEARTLPDGTAVIVAGVALTDGDFTDGGGYLADVSAGIAVLVSDATFTRGQLLRIAGTLDDRYSQRTIRSAAAEVTLVGAGSEPLPVDAATGSIGEAVEGQLVELTGLITSSATILSTGVAWDLDDGTGAIRIVIGAVTGIDTAGWERGVGLTLIGVVGQRDSSGSGSGGFRVQPRDPSDILAVEPAPTPSPSPSPTLAPTATPSASASASPTASPAATPPGVVLVSVAEARAAAIGAHLRIRGVVTAQSGLLEAGSAVVQDSTGAILIRMGSRAGTLSLGQLVELDGIRATKAGMLSLRVGTPPLLLGTQADPNPVRRATGALGEADEAHLVITRGAISTPISRPRGGAVSFEIDDGSGPIRVTISPRSGIPTRAIRRGAWVELRGVLGQATTGKAPLQGYRLWPRMRADLVVIAAPVSGAGAISSCCTPSSPTLAPQAGGQGAGRQGTGGAPGVPPILARPHPTLAPAQPVTAPPPTSSTPRSPHGSGLVVSGMGLAALAGLAAWFDRRRRASGETAAADASPAVHRADPDVPGPQLSLLRAELEDPPEERRILPPT